MDLVTADGRVVCASEASADDLFWALRGGGGNFGIVTSFEYSLHPVGPEIVAGMIGWSIKDAPAVLEMYLTLTAQAQPELTCAALLRKAPPFPWLPTNVHGQPIVLFLVCHTGPAADAEKHVAPIKAFGSPVGDIIQRRPYVSQQSLLDASQPKGRRYYWKSEFLPDLKTELLEKCIEHAERIVSSHSAIVLFPVQGALNRLSMDHSAIGNRNAAWVVNITASWEAAEQDTQNIEWAREAWGDMRSFSTGGTYVNFLTEEEGDERIHAAYGENYDRLVAVKRKWDPGNLFRMNKNIPSEGS